MKSKVVYFCSECGYETPKWMGKCPGCGAWNTMTEQKIDSYNKVNLITSSAKNIAESLNNIESSDEERISTGFEEMDRVLGGGMVNGSLVLVGGEPGIGKSTLLLQMCGNLNRFKILYATGEESQKQLKLRANRLGINGENIIVLAETKLSNILSAVELMKPDLLIVDSIQTIYKEETAAAPGNVAQVKECTMVLMELAKQNNLTTFIVGHVNKEGAIAGPKVLEHMVDCVLYFEGDRQLSYRVLRAAKNRFGSTNEIGVFDMSSDGLIEIRNPSQIFLSERNEPVPGTAVACVMEGTRPMLTEIQALVAKSSFSTPRRMTQGIDYNRTMLLLAVLEKRTGFQIGASDAYVNVVGGFQFNEPAADLPILLAVASSLNEKPIPSDLVSFGEVGLTGELRNVIGMQQRINEVARLGFKKCILPARGLSQIKVPETLEIIPVRSVREALAKVFYLN